MPAETPAEKALNVKINGDIADAAMNAFYGANLHPRWRDFVQAAIAAYTHHLEEEHNNGEPFPRRPGENLPRGRKVGISPARAKRP